VLNADTTKPVKAVVDENGQTVYREVTSIDDAFVGFFVLRPAYIHRWKPAVDYTYPMAIEINPQAIKNAAIEGALINLFGQTVFSDGAITADSAHDEYNDCDFDTFNPDNPPATPCNLMHTDYLAPRIEKNADGSYSGAAARDAYLSANGYDADPIFAADADNFYRVIIAAALVNEAKREVVAKKFLQFIYNARANRVVDQQFFEPE
jgi:hypothetical protein